MRLPLDLSNQRHACIVGALLTALLGLILLHSSFRLGKSLVNASYDWSFDLCPFRQVNMDTSQVVIVYMDEASYRELQQPFNAPWDRALHARLLERLTASGAQAVLFDILFSDPGPSESADAALAQALRAHGSVVLAADNAPGAQSALSGELTAWTTLTLPYEPFRQAAAAWGLAQLQPDNDFIVRQHYHGPRDEPRPSMSWALAQTVRLPLTKDPAARHAERWVNYYGGPETIPHVSYAQALRPDGVRPEFFRDKIVVIGARPITGSFIERRDELRSSFSTLNTRFIFMPAVEVHATILLNLLRGDWLRRWPAVAEWLVLLAVAAAAGYGLTRFRPLTAGLVAAGGAIGLIGVAMVFFGQSQVWFPWLIPVAAQVPFALGWSILHKSVEWYVQKRKLEQERRAAEQRIREQAALLDKAQDAILVHDFEGHPAYWNKSAERLYGWTLEEVQRLGLKDALFKLEPRKWGEALASAHTQGEWLGEVRQPTRAAKEVTVYSRWTLVRDAQGEPQCILAINTDITEKKLLEAQFLRAQRLESIGVLAGGIAHDLNNVLSPILMAVEILQIRSPDERSLNLLKTIGTSAKRGADMVKQVLAFARGHAGERTTLQLNHLIREMQKIARETFPKSIQLGSNVAPDLWPIQGDATQLHQILLNLCVNARDAMPDGGQILIGASNVTLGDAAIKSLVHAKPGPYVLLSVADTGTGIPPEIRETIFEPFFTTKEIGKGTGLGLSTVMSIVKAHEGAIDLESEVGKGTTFKLYFPALPAAEAPAAAPTPREKLAGHGEAVLVVDDEPAMRETLSGALTQAGYRVTTASHGAEALTICSQESASFACAIVDLMMPVLDGAKTISHLRRLRPEMRIVAISGLPQTDDALQHLASQDVPFLFKPFSREKLLEVVSRNPKG